MFHIVLACTNLRRQARKNILAAALWAVIVLFLCTYVQSLLDSQNQLDALPQVIPVTAHISNLDGSQMMGLQISDSIIEKIEASGLVSDMTCTIQLGANFTPETPEEQARPKKISVVGVSDLAVYPSIQPNDLNSGTDFLKARSAECIISRWFMENNGLKNGDTIELELYRLESGAHPFFPFSLRYDYLSPVAVKIIGNYEPSSQTDGAVLPDIICPIGWVKSVFMECGADIWVNSASFTVSDPLNLDRFKDDMKKLGLKPVDPQAVGGVDGTALVVDDETFIRTATSLRNNLFLLRAFAPVLIAVVLLAGYVVSHLMTQNRRGEFAVMRSLGAGKLACYATLLIETAALAFAGSLVGTSSALLLTGVDPVAALAVAAVFFAVYLLGATIAVRMLGRLSVINILSKAE